MEQFHNCPNCGGYLNDAGRCEFCGSKVYDFVNVDFDKHNKTYIRIRSNGKIITAPVIFNVGTLTVDTSMSTADMCYSSMLFQEKPILTGTIDYLVVGDVITESPDDGVV